MSSLFIFHRFTPIILGLVTALVFLLTSQYPSSYVFLMGLNTVFSFILIANLLKWRFRKMVFWQYIISPMLFLISGAALFLFIESGLIRSFLSLVIGLTLFFYTEHIFNLFFWSNKYQKNAIPHTAIVLNVLTVFFLATALSGFRLFFHSPLWGVAVIFALVTFVVIATTFKLSQIQTDRSMIFGIVGGIILTELFLVISFFPTGLYVNGAIISILAYAFLGLSRAYLSDILSKNIFRRYAITGISLLLLIMSTATWT